MLCHCKIFEHKTSLEEISAAVRGGFRVLFPYRETRIFPTNCSRFRRFPYDRPKRSKLYSESINVFVATSFRLLLVEIPFVASL